MSTPRRIKFLRLRILLTIRGDWEGAPVLVVLAVSLASDKSVAPSGAFFGVAHVPHRFRGGLRSAVPSGLLLMTDLDRLA